VCFFVSNAIVLIIVMVSIPVKKKSSSSDICASELDCSISSQSPSSFVLCSDYIICLEVFVEQLCQIIYLNSVTRPCTVLCNTCFIALRGNALN